MPKGTGGTGRGATAHRRRTFVRNLASVLLASDFCVVVTARFRVVYVFVVMELGSRRLVHLNVTSHPTAAWTLGTLANAYCERLLGSPRRECLDFVIPLTENHLLRILKAWMSHYNRGRPHMSLGPGIPDPPAGLPAPPFIGHRLPSDSRVVTRSILGGLHHEYGLEKVAA